MRFPRPAFLALVLVLVLALLLPPSVTATCATCGGCRNLTGASRCICAIKLCQRRRRDTAAGLLAKIHNPAVKRHKRLLRRLAAPEAFLESYAPLWKGRRPFFAAKAQSRRDRAVKMLRGALTDQ